MAEIRKRLSSAERKRIAWDRLRQLIHYDPETGLFTRIAAPRPQAGHYVGQVAGHVKYGSHADGGGYIMLTVDGRKYRGHALAWFYMTGEWPVHDIDHKDTDRTNNRWSNLRLATRSQNIANARRARDNQSGFKGVSFDKSRNKWKAQIGMGKSAKGYYGTKLIGRFNTKEEAAEAYRRAAESRFGEFARAA